MQLLLNRYKYSNDDLIGKGGFSNVYKGYDIKTGNYIAIKIDNKIKYNKKEAQIYKKVNNFKYMAKYIDYFELNKKSYLIMPLYYKSSDKILKINHDFFNEKDVLMLGIQILQQLNYLHKRMLAKLSAFSENPVDTLKKVDAIEKDEIALLKKTIALHLKPDQKNAFETLRKLKKLKPKDPYFMELEGQMYLETGQAAKAIDIFSKASKILPTESTLLVWIGISHLAIEKSPNDIKALKVLKTAYDSDPINPKMLKYLALAYARNGNIGQASLITAEYFVLLGDFKAAQMHAKRAQKILMSSSVGWQKAKDILDISSKIGVNN